MIRAFLNYFARRSAVKEAACYEEMRRLSDNFGNGSLLRYGADRFGTEEDRKLFAFPNKAVYPTKPARFD